MSNIKNSTWDRLVSRKKQPTEKILTGKFICISEIDHVVTIEKGTLKKLYRRLSNIYQTKPDTDNVAVVMIGTYNIMEVKMRKGTLVSNNFWKALSIKKAPYFNFFFLEGFCWGYEKALKNASEFTTENSQTCNFVNSHSYIKNAKCA